MLSLNERISPVVLYQKSCALNCVAAMSIVQICHLVWSHLRVYMMCRRQLDSNRFIKSCPLFGEEREKLEKGG